MKKTLILAAMLAAAAMPLHAALFITEVAPWSSGDSPVGSDWFELTNTGSTALTITGWKVDDNSNSFGAAITLSGITSIGAGESVVFIETTSGQTASGNAAAFHDVWTNAPLTLQIGSYGGSGIGLSTGGDALNIYNASGVLQANVTFGNSTSGRTFDNSANVNNAAISLLSTAGVNGAFVTPNGEVGSPGVVASPVPEPGTAAFGLGLVGMVLSRRRRVARGA